MWPNYVVALGWMPWIVLLGLRSCCDGGPWRAWVLVSALQLLAGVPELTVMTWIILGVLVLERLVSGAVPFKPVLLKLAGVVLVVSGLCMVQLLPFFQMLELSQRTSGYYEEKWAMPLTGVANFFLPLFRYFTTAQGSFVQEGQNFLTSYYPGLPFLALGALGVMKSKGRLRWFLLGLIGVSVWLAMGQAGLLLPVAKSILPLLKIFRYPVKWLFVMAFVLPLLAAAGMAWLESAEEGREKERMMFLWKGIAGVAIGVLLMLMWSRSFYGEGADAAVRFLSKTAMTRLLLLGLFAGLLFLPGMKQLDRAKRWPYQRLLMALLVLEGISAIPNRNPTLPSDILLPMLARHDHKMELESWVGRQRIFISRKAEERLLRSWVESHFDDMYGKRLAMWSNLNVLDRAPKVNGSSTLRMRHEDEVEKLFYPDGPSDASYERLKDFLGVSFQTSAASVVEWDSRPTAMAWVTAGQVAVSMEQPFDMALADESFRPAEMVYVDPLPEGVEADPEAKVDLVSAGLGRLELTALASRQTMLVMAQSWHPGWEVSIDGEPAPILRANHAFMATVIPAGEHQVVFEYHEPSLALGGALSGASFLVIMVWPFFFRRGNTGRREEPLPSSTKAS